MKKRAQRRRESRCFPIATRRFDVRLDAPFLACQLIAFARFSPRLRLPEVRAAGVSVGQVSACRTGCSTTAPAFGPRMVPRHEWRWSIRARTDP